MSCLTQQPDLDMGVVKTTLSELGFNELAISDLVGGPVHVLSTSTSITAASDTCTSSSSAAFDQSHGSGFCTEEDLTGAMLELPAEQMAQLHGVPLPRDGESLLDVGALRRVSQKEVPTFRATDVNHRNIPKVSGPTPRSWDKSLLKEERRRRYMKHLNALEKLFAIFLSITTTTDSDNSGLLDGDGFLFPIQSLGVPQEAADEHKKESRQNATSCQSGKSILQPSLSRNICFNIKYPSRLVGSCHLNKDGTQRDGTCPNSRVGVCKIHLWPCELCVAIKSKPFPSQRWNRHCSAQITSTPHVAVCRVNMRPRSMSAVGRGRINSRSLVTTLPRRDDRVKRFHAYREVWKNARFVSGRASM
ncbi:hypothetical protein TRVL_02491 [Trypanosoma vivax]|nr:hypothetical protein TRVL_02491 [Trypanosoma vivax]